MRDDVMKFAGDPAALLDHRLPSALGQFTGLRDELPFPVAAQADRQPGRSYCASAGVSGEPGCEWLRSKKSPPPCRSSPRSFDAWVEGGT